MKNTKKILFTFFVSAFSLLLISNYVSSQQTAGELFEKASYLEEAKGDLQKAIDLYQKILKQFPENREVAAKAQLHIGICYEKLGLKKAQNAFQKVIDNYPEQAEAVKLAKEKLNLLLSAKALLKKGKKEYKVTLIHSGPIYPYSLSPDGKKLALSDHKDWDIWLKDIATGEKVKLTDETNMIRGMVWSPDSKMIAFNDNFHNIYVVSAKGGPSQMIIKADPESEKAKDKISISGWTSDSKKILFQIPSKGLFAISAAGGEWEEIFTFQDPKKAKKYEEMTLSPDGKLIAYSSTQNGNKDIYVMPVEGGESVKITSNPAKDSWPKWSYDGKWLAFLSTRTESPEIWVIKITPEGKPDAIPFQVSRGGAYDGGWTRDNNGGYTTVKRTENIYISNEDGSEEFQLTTFPAFNKDPRWSPDGKKIAFSSDYGLHINNFRIWIVPSSGGEAKLLTRGEYPSWSPDGKMIAFCTNRSLSRTQGKGTISIIPAEGGDPKEIITLDKDISFVDWSPDGKNIVFCLDIRPPMYANVQEFLKLFQRSIYMIPVDGGEPVQITKNKPGLQTTSCRWSPDGKMIAIRNYDQNELLEAKKIENSGFWTIDVDSGERKLITRELDGWYLNWSPDGKYIISSKYEKGSKESWDKGHFLYKVSSKGGEPEKLNIKGRHPAYSSDGKKIAYSRRLEGYYEFWLVENFLPKEKETK